MSDANAGGTTPMPKILPAETGAPQTLETNTLYQFNNMLPSTLNISLQPDGGSTCGSFGPTPQGVPVCSLGGTLVPDASCHIECRATGET